MQVQPENNSLYEYLDKDCLTSEDDLIFVGIRRHNYEVNNDASGRPTKCSSDGRYFPQVRAHDGAQNCPFVALGVPSSSSKYPHDYVYVTGQPG